MRERARKPSGGRTAFPARLAAARGALAEKAEPFDLLDEEAVLFVLHFGMRLTARTLGLSERTFRRQFERKGLRLSDLLGDRRRQMALRLLASDLPVRTIADRLGFASSQTFARFLRREFGATATALR
ncbi:MAG: helix-turn-helix domain-containing protein, partial [Thermoanaerobaculia bacterium]